MCRLLEDNETSFDAICAAMKKLFEPECRKKVFVAEFQMKKKWRRKDWVSFA